GELGLDEPVELDEPEEPGAEPEEPGSEPEGAPPEESSSAGSAAGAGRAPASSSSRRAARMRRKVLWSRARSRMATSSWAAANSVRSPLPGADSAASAAANASDSDMSSE